MKLLFLTSRLPYPPDRGDRTRVFYLLQHLAAEHQITLVTFVSQRAELAQLDGLKPYTTAVRWVPQGRMRSIFMVGAHFWRRQPLQALYYRSPKMQLLLDNLLVNEPFDAVYCHLFRMAPYLEPYDHLYRIVDLTDLISREIADARPYHSPLWRLVYGLELPRIERYERRVAQRFNEVWLVSEPERAALATAVPAANVQAVGLGVALTTPPAVEPVAPVLTFIGHLDVYHNVDAVRWLAGDILPRVRERVPAATLRIVGAGRGDGVADLAALPGVTLDGFVPDLGTVLRQTAVSVAPLRFAAGVQNKVLDAMAGGRPVVTTPVVNMGIGAQDGRDLLLAEDAAGLAAQIVALLQDPPRRAAIGASARRFVAQHFTWQTAVARMRRIEAGLQAHRAAPGRQA